MSSTTMQEAWPCSKGTTTKHRGLPGRSEALRLGWGQWPKHGCLQGAAQVCSSNESAQDPNEHLPGWTSGASMTQGLPEEILLSNGH